MRKKINRELETVPNWLMLAQDEKLLFCGISSKDVTNPLTNEKYSECVVLTDKRLVVLTDNSLTTTPLYQIQLIHIHKVAWTFQKVIGVVLGFVLYIIPGLIALVYIQLKKGTYANVVVGNVRKEIRFSNSSPLLKEFITCAMPLIVKVEET